MIMGLVHHHVTITTPTTSSALLGGGGSGLWIGHEIKANDENNYSESYINTLKINQNFT
jgi:hypothetical protein